MTTALPFRKMNGLGNEIVVVDLRGTDRVLSDGEARAIARRPGRAFRPDDGAA
jgi:diaminopimelate epimerase